MKRLVFFGFVFLMALPFIYAACPPDCPAATTETATTVGTQLNEIATATTATGWTDQRTTAILNAITQHRWTPQQLRDAFTGSEGNVQAIAQAVARMPPNVALAYLRAVAGSTGGTLRPLHQTDLNILSRATTTISGNTATSRIPLVGGFATQLGEARITIGPNGVADISLTTKSGLQINMGAEGRLTFDRTTSKFTLHGQAGTPVLIRELQGRGMYSLNANGEPTFQQGRTTVVPRVHRRQGGPGPQAGRPPVTIGPQNTEGTNRAEPWRYRWTAEGIETVNGASTTFSLSGDTDIITASSSSPFGLDFIFGNGRTATAGNGPNGLTLAGFPFFNLFSSENLQGDTTTLSQRGSAAVDVAHNNRVVGVWRGGPEWADEVFNRPAG